MSAVRTTITEACAEAMADRIIMRRLETDRAYNNAPDAETQAAREDDLSAQVWREIEDKYEIGG